VSGGGGHGGGGGGGHGGEGQPGQPFPVKGAVLAGVLLIGLAAAGAEAVVRWRGEEGRAAAYAGGAGALLAGLSGLPFLLKIARITDVKDSAFWRNWGLGLLTRTLVGLIAAIAVLKFLPAHGDAGVLVLALVYFAALMIETMWLALRLART